MAHSLRFMLWPDACSEHSAFSTCYCMFTIVDLQCQRLNSVQTQVSNKRIYSSIQLHLFNYYFPLIKLHYIDWCAYLTSNHIMALRYYTLIEIFLQFYPVISSSVHFYLEQITPFTMPSCLQHQMACSFIQGTFLGDFRGSCLLL